MKTYGIIDEMMLGQCFNGDREALRYFCKLLTKKGYNVEACLDSCNGGKLEDGIPEEVWNECLCELDELYQCFK